MVFSEYTNFRPALFIDTEKRLKVVRNSLISNAAMNDKSDTIDDLRTDNNLGGRKAFFLKFSTATIIDCLLLPQKSQ